MIRTFLARVSKEMLQREKERAMKDACKQGRRTTGAQG